MIIPWRFPPNLELLSSPPALGGCATYHNIVFTEAAETFLKARMPVDSRTHQPFGLLHGGASCVLAETLGSVASNLIIEPGTIGVGQSLYANHLRPISSGFVYATARLKHRGRRTHIWDINIESEEGKAVCTVVFTVAIVPKP